MRTITIESFEGGPALQEAPAPQVGPSEVLVRVRASSVNPMDGAIAAGMLKDMVEHEFPVVLGRDFAGVVEQVGEGVDFVSPGDEVFGVVPAIGAKVHDGAWAELIAASEQTTVRKPDGVDTPTAGAVGLAGVTAIMLVDALELSQGDSVLVVGATGGVGSIVVQLAKAAGATVLASTLPEDEEFLRGLGVDEVFPRDGDLVALARERHPDGVDALVDAVTPYQPTPYDGVLRDGGRVASPTNAAGEGPGRTNVMNSPSPETLGRIARHLADGTLKVPIQQTFDLAQAPEALQTLQAGHTQGKIAIRVA
jgi:NADPH2:quinone reductase